MERVQERETRSTAQVTESCSTWTLETPIGRETSNYLAILCICIVCPRNHFNDQPKSCVDPEAVPWPPGPPKVPRDGPNAPTHNRHGKTEQNGHTHPESLPWLHLTE